MCPTGAKEGRRSELSVRLPNSPGKINTHVTQWAALRAPASPPDRPHRICRAQWLQEVTPSLESLMRPNSRQQQQTWVLKWVEGCTAFPLCLCILKGQNSRSKLWTKKASPVGRRRKPSGLLKDPYLPPVIKRPKGGFCLSLK